ncbi:MAG: hypothetical protein IJT50_13965, partial [Lentisphaeria bacterium]|nr:hypothetical protein [Lentisphaeria bacterium]
ALFGGENLPEVARKSEAYTLPQIGTGAIETKILSSCSLFLSMTIPTSPRHDGFRFSIIYREAAENATREEGFSLKFRGMTSFGRASGVNYDKSERNSPNNE